MIDLQLFFPPLTRKTHFPELGMPQLTAYLRARGLTVRQSDLNALFCAFRPLPRERLAELRRPFAEPGADPLALWSGPPRDPGLWNGGAARCDAAELCARARQASPLYEKLYEASVRGPAAEARVTGFSIFTTAQVLPALFLARRLREDLGAAARIVFGGPWVNASWTALEGWPELFELVDCFAAISGERALETAVRAAADGGGLPRRLALPGPPLEELPPPVFDGVGLEGLAPEERMLPYQTTSGCEWGRCRFCYHVPPENRRRSKPAPLIAEHMAGLSRVWDARRFGLADLATPLDTILAVSDEFVRRGLRLEWEALARSHPRLTADAARRLSAAGCRALYVGLETASPASLRRLGKGLSLPILERNLDACARAGIRTSLFLLNYPEQSLAELEDSVAYGLRRTAAHGAELILQRFELGRTTFGRLPFAVRPAPDAGRDLDSFNVPFYAEGVPKADFLKVWRKAQEESSRLRARAGAGAPGTASSR